MAIPEQTFVPMQRKLTSSAAPTLSDDLNSQSLLHATKLGPARTNIKGSPPMKGRILLTGTHLTMLAAGFALGISL